MKTTYCNSILLVAVFATAVPAIAAVSAEEAKQLGQSLTAWGAEKAGNKEGTIPAYTGERPKPPASYNPKEPGNLPDPYNEKPLFSITAQNLGQYADKLSEGQKTIFKTYPSFRMDVYPTHRSQAYSPAFIENTLKNATSCKAEDNGLRLEGCYGGIPFPIPKNGNEAVWNHQVNSPHRYVGHVYPIVVDRNGGVTQFDYATWMESPYLDQSIPGARASDSPFQKLRFDALSPARKVGENTIIIDYLNMVRRAWQYIPGQRRVKLAPDLAFDTPSPAANGNMTMDENKVFFGSQERYNMKLVGKKEVFMMYNNFDLTDYRKCPAEKLATKNFLNPDCVRWELHRAWVVEATIKSGFRHIMPKRVFYFDEDSSAGFGEGYDAGGKMYRFDSNFFYPWYQYPYEGNAESNFTLELATGAYQWEGNSAVQGGGLTSAPNRLSDTLFSPETMAGAGVR